MKYLKNLTPTQLIGLIILAALLIFAYGSPLISPHDMALQNLDVILSAPSGEHPFGTDHLGRDMMARLASAIRLSFSLIVGSVGVSLIFGLLFGLLAGIFLGGFWISFLTLSVIVSWHCLVYCLSYCLRLSPPTVFGRCIWAYHLSCGWSFLR